MTDDPLALDGVDLVAAYAGGAVLPSTVVEACLDRLAALDTAHHTTIRVLRDGARALARESDARFRAGTPRALEGVPFGVKDVIDVAGVPTTAGSWVSSDEPARRSAAVVERLVAAGAIPVSKDATTEFAVGGPRPPRFGATTNPWSRESDGGPARWAGGSSTGSAAAVAARAVTFALGTDVGGSVRLPAAWCGLTGLKPTTGAVPRTGVVPLSWTAETVGPLCRSARDAARVFALLRGADGVDPRARALPPLEPGVGDGDLTGLRVAVVGGWVTELCDDAVRAGTAAAVATLADAGAEITTGAIPSAQDALTLGYQVVFAEAATLHRVDADRWGSYDPVTVRRIAAGIAVSAVDYLRALQFRVELQHELDALFATADVAVLPTCPSTAPYLHDDGSAVVLVDGVEHPLHAAQSRSTMIGNLSGAPGLAVPSGFAPDGFPTSVQLIAPPHREDRLLRVAHALQRRTGHHDVRPPWS